MPLVLQKSLQVQHVNKGAHTTVAVMPMQRYAQSFYCWCNIHAREVCNK